MCKFIQKLYKLEVKLFNKLPEAIPYMVEFFKRIALDFLDDMKYSWKPFTIVTTNEQPWSWC